MELFDSHFHFYGEAGPLEFMNGVRQALGASPQAELGRVERLFLCTMGDSFAESLRAQGFAQAVDDTVFACGVHPHEAEKFLAAREDFNLFRQDPKLAAIGELGLDYFYDLSDHAAQQQVFAEFLDLALAWDLPAVVHLRDRDGAEQAYADGEALLRPFAAAGGRFVVHCYSGSPEYLERFLALGACIGVTGMVTFRRSDNIRALIPLIPEERLLIETDSPYLAPVPHRGSENHPGFLILVAAEVARVRGMTLEETARITVTNAKRFFSLA